MIDASVTLQAILRDAGFTTQVSVIDGWSLVCFEDEELTGFGYVFDSPRSLLSEWSSIEAAFLRRYGSRLRVAGQKAWNVYSIFLCSTDADPVLAREVGWIEEDLDRTRKIAATGLKSRLDITQALLPILPLQHQAIVDTQDVSELLEERIRRLAPDAARVVLDESVSVDEVVLLLGEST